MSASVSIRVTILGSLTLILALVLASAPLALLVTGGTGTMVLALAAGLICGTALILRLLRAPAWLLALGQLGGLVVTVLVTEGLTGSLPSGLTAVVPGQPGVIAQGIQELGTGHAPLALAGPGTAVLAVLLGLVTLVLDVLVADLRLRTVGALAVACFALAPAPTMPEGGPWWATVCPLLGALLILGAPALARARLLPALVLGGAAVLGLGPAITALVPTPDPAPYPLTLDTLNTLLGRTQDLGPVMIDESVSVRRDLLQGTEREVLRFTSTARDPGYLRLRTLGTYRNGQFVSDLRAENTPGPATFSDTQLQSDPPPRSSDIGRYDVRITDLSSATLPAPASPRWTNADVYGSEVTQTAGGELELRRRRATLAGMRYQVHTQLPLYTDADLQTVQQEDLGSPTGVSVPTRVPGTVSALAQRVARDAGATTPYDTARAFETYFHENFTYDLHARSRSDEDPMEAFLRDRSGYCEQYAATFALMMDAMGYPARVVGGFTGGSVTGSEHRVTTHDAHAWPEVWFGAPYGWVRFEPTPASAGAGVSEPTFATDDATDADTQLEDSASASAAATPTPTAQSPSSAAATPSTSASPATAAGTSRPARPGSPLALVLGAASLIALLVAGVAWGMRRLAHGRRERAWQQLQAAGDVAGGAERAWQELTAAAGSRRSRRRGLRLDPALPPQEALADLLDRAEGAGVPVTADDHERAERLGRAIARARYAPQAATGAGVREDTEALLAVLARRPRRR